MVPHHHPQHIADITNYFLLEGTNRGRDSPDLLVKVRIETMDARRPGVHPDRQHPLHVRIGLRDRDSWFEAGDALKKETSQMLLVAVKS